MDASKATYAELNIDAITIDRGFNVFNALDKPALFELGESLVADGQLMPVIVNRTGDEEYHLLAGEQRITALRAAGVETVECKIYRDVDAVRAARMHIIENIRRRKPEPMEEARGMKRLSDLGQTTGQIAKVFDVSDDTVLRRLKLLDLPGEVQKMIERRICPLPIHQALMLDKLTPSDALQLARQIAPKTGPILGEAETRQLVDDHLNRDQKPLPGLGKTEGKKSGVGSQEQSSVVNRQSSIETATAQKKKTAKSAVGLQPVKGTFAIAPATFRITDDGELTVSGVMTLKLDTGGDHPQLHTAKLTNFALGLDAADTAATLKLIKKCQKNGKL